MKKLIALVSVLLVLVLGICTALATEFPEGFLDVEEDVYLFGKEDYEVKTTIYNVKRVEIPEGFTLPKEAPKEGCYVIAINNPTAWTIIEEDYYYLPEFVDLVIAYNGEIVQTSPAEWEELEPCNYEVITFSDGKSKEFRWTKRKCVDVVYTKKGKYHYQLIDGYNYVITFKDKYISVDSAVILYSRLNNGRVPTFMNLKIKEKIITFTDKDTGITFATYDVKKKGKDYYMSIYDLAEVINNIPRCFEKMHEDK